MFLRRTIPNGVLRLPLGALPIALAAFSNPQAEAYNLVESRWTSTASGDFANTPGTPVTLTWSIVPDTTFIAASTDRHDAGTSNLLSTLDDKFGAGPGGNDLTQRPWFTYYDQAYSRLSELSGVTFIYEPNDDGTDLNSAPGVLGVRGDLRLGARSYFESSTILAYNWYPASGDMVANSRSFTSGKFLNSFDNYRYFRGTLMHETMHGLGVLHTESSNAVLLMEPSHQTQNDGPQLDDILAIQRLYGDRLEKNGRNNTYQTATSLGALSPSQSLAVGANGDNRVVSSADVDFVSISGAADTDYFSFTIPANSTFNVNLELTPRGAIYQMGPEDGTQITYNTQTLNNLALQLYNTNGTSLLATANSNPAGGAETVSWQLSAGTYFARVRSGAEDDVQLYGLNLTAAARDLIWVGNISSTWSMGGALNFQQSIYGVTSFLAVDSVQFDDSSSVKTVTISGNVAPTDMRVTTSTNYTFTGAGGVTAERLIVDGPGMVTLANTGSSNYGDVEVSAGALRVTGAANSKDLAVNSAALQIESGGDVVNQFVGYIGFNTGTSGSATVSGAGSTWTNDILYVGYNGIGFLNVNSSGSVTSFLGTVGYRSSGTTTVSGNNSQWTVTELLLVGERANGELNAQSGGDVFSKDVYLGSFSGSAGSVTVTGLGSLLQSSGSLYVGGSNSAAGGAGVLNIANNAAVTVSNTLHTWSGGTVNLSGGMLKTSTLNIAQGTFDMTGGRLVADAVTGNLTNVGGTLAPGDSLGITSITGNYTQYSGASLEIEIGDVEQGTGFDFVSASGTASLAGTLAVSLINGFMPAFGDSFQVLLATGGIGGVFADEILPMLDGSLAWNIHYSADAVMLSIGLKGDFNHDGLVNAADYVVWRKTGIDGPTGYNTWRAHFGQVANGVGTSAMGSNVPEPTSLVLCLMLAAIVWVTPRTLFRQRCDD